MALDPPPITADRQTTNPRQLSDLQLLTIEIETLWPGGPGDGRGHHEPPPRLVVAAADHGLVAVPSQDVPAELATQLVRTVDDAPPTEVGRPPAVLEPCRRLLAELPGPLLETAAGPSYVVQPPVQVPPPVDDGSAATVVTSENDARRVPACPESWESGEWAALLAGERGPWALTLAPDASVVAVCHTPVWSGRAVEAGVWTRPDARGLGHAACATASWARLSAHEDRLLFYSTGAANRSSQRVAARLGLRPIGWLWKLRQPHFSAQS